MIPRFGSYGQYKSGNYGAHSLMFTIGKIDFYFSYDTLVAVACPFLITIAPYDGMIVRQNDWSTTTGKHLNWIDGGEPANKKKRLTATEFERQLQLVLEHYGLNREAHTVADRYSKGCVNMVHNEDIAKHGHCLECQRSE